MTSVDNVLHHTEFNVQIHTIQLEWPRNWLDVGNTALRKEETWDLHQTGFGATKEFRNTGHLVRFWLGGMLAVLGARSHIPSFDLYPMLRRKDNLTQVEILRIVVSWSMSDSVYQPTVSTGTNFSMAS